VIRTVASRGQGIDEIVAAVDKHRSWLESHGELVRRREARACAEIEAIVLGVLRERIGTLRNGSRLSTDRRALPELAAKVAAGELDPYAAAGELLIKLDG
jgi:LAO/AO transport system kinase